MATVKQLEELLKQAHKPELAKESMVYQVWEDGEITLQKGGDLLWKRNLHSVSTGLSVRVPPQMMPLQTGSPDFPKDYHGYAFVTGEDAGMIREAIRDLEDRPEYNPEPNRGPLNLMIYTERDVAERVKDYLVKEFPMARDGKLEVFQPTEGYWAGKNMWQIRFPNDHDHWVSYKITIDKMNSAAGDYIRGYDAGYRQGQVDEAHKFVVGLTKPEINRLAETWATEGEIEDAIYQIRHPRVHDHWSHENTKAVQTWLWDKRKLRSSTAAIKSRAVKLGFTYMV